MDAKEIYKCMYKSKEITDSAEEKLALDELCKYIFKVTDEHLKHNIISSLMELRDIERVTAFDKGFKAAVSLILSADK